MSTALVTLTSQLAKRLDIGASGEDLITILKATAFKGPATDAQMTALMVVANQYGLNPWTKEIYAFPDKNNGIVPVVGVDGWSRIINEHPQFDGMEFEQDDNSCTCKMYRKDRGHAIAITEYRAECARDTGPWKSHPKRMLRHKAMIQCARLSFGYVGIYDQDEAERIIEKDITADSSVVTPSQAAYPQDSFEKNFSAWAKLVAEKKKTPEQIIATLSSRGIPTEEQRAALLALKVPTGEPSEAEIAYIHAKEMAEAGQVPINGDKG